jgi:hypothetical protein
MSKYDTEMGEAILRQAAKDVLCYGRPSTETEREAAGLVRSLCSRGLAVRSGLGWSRVDGTKQVAHFQLTEAGEAFATTKNDQDTPDTIHGTPTTISAGRRLALSAENGLNITPGEKFEPEGWWVSYSPRNDNNNAEGPWSEWVALAKAVLAEDERRKQKNTGPSGP